MRRLRFLILTTLCLSCSDDGLAPAQSGTGTTTGQGSLPTDTDDEASLTVGGGVSTSTGDGPPAPTGTGEGDTGGDGTSTGSDDSTGSGGTGSDGGSSSGSDGGSSSDDGGSSSEGGSSSGGTMASCPDIAGTSLIGGPADLYGFCWYLTAPMDTCDSACNELVGGANLAPMAESSYPDHCNGAAADDVSTWFFDNGNPGGWSSVGGTTAGHTLGYGYSMVGNFYGKCSTGGVSVGTYPGEMVGGGLENERQLVCACAVGS